MSNYAFNPLRAVWPAGADPEAWAFAVADTWQVGDAPGDGPGFAARLAATIGAALADALGTDVPVVAEVTLAEGGEVLVRAGILWRAEREVDADEAEIVTDLLDDNEAEARWIAAARKVQE